MMLLMFIVVLIFSWWLPWWWTAFLGFALGWWGAKKGLSKKRLSLLAFHGVYWPLLPVLYWFDLRTQGAAAEQLASLAHLPWSGFVLMLSPLPMTILSWSSTRWSWHLREWQMQDKHKFEINPDAAGKICEAMRASDSPSSAPQNAPHRPRPSSTSGGTSL